MPDYWENTGSSINFSVIQESTIIHSGSYSAELVWISIDTHWIQQEVIVNPGTDYSFSCWVYDNDSSGRVRIYIQFRDSGGSLVGSSIPSPYSIDSPSWQELAIAPTAAPIDAAIALFQIRCYDEAGWDGNAVVFLDDVSMQSYTPPTPTPTPLPNPQDLIDCLLGRTEEWDWDVNDDNNIDVSDLILLIQF